MEEVIENESCQEYYYKFGENCIQNQCQDPFYLASTGKCEKCDKSYKLNENGTGCIKICSKKQKRSIDGQYCME